jgi:transcriptional regulator with XRE-family HTH domain
MMDGKAIGDKMRRLRGSRSQKEVADALGVTAMAISLYETGQRIPSDDMKIKIAEYYNRSVAFIFYK